MIPLPPSAHAVATHANALAAALQAPAAAKRMTARKSVPTAAVPQKLEEHNLLQR